MGVAVISGSTRSDSNSEMLAQRVVAEMPVANFPLPRYHIESIVDGRHQPGGFAAVNDDNDRLIRSLLTRS